MTTENLFKFGLHSGLCQSIIDDIQTNRVAYYQYIGRVGVWDSPDTLPPSYDSAMTDKPVTDIETRHEIVAIKKINFSDVSYVVPRINWTSGNTYNAYNDTSDSAFDTYVYDAASVFRCIQNISSTTGLSIPSTVTPGTGLVVDTYYTSTDNAYIWKKLYDLSLTSSNARKFLTSDWMPVQTAATNNYYSNNPVDLINIVAAGNGYNTTISLGSVTFIISSNVCTLTFTSLLTAQFVPGSYILITGVATYTYLNSAWVVKSSTATTITFDITHANVSSTSIPSIVVSGNVLPSINLSINAVSIASNIATLSFPTSPLTGLSISAGEYVVISGVDEALFDTIGNPVRAINGVRVVTNFTGGNSIQIALTQTNLSSTSISSDNTKIGMKFSNVVIEGDGYGASFSAIASSGAITTINTNCNGFSYSYASAKLIGMGNGAVLTPSLRRAYQANTQSLIEESANQADHVGSIHYIELLTQGENYPENGATATITGDGQGCTVSPIVGTSFPNVGKVIKIPVTSPGYGYTYASITFNTPGGGTEATGRPIISPYPSHGSNAPAELRSDTICLYSNMRFAGFNPISTQKFREYGIIKGLRDTTTNDLINVASGSFTYGVILTSGSGLSGITQTAIDAGEVILTSGTLTEKKFRLLELNFVSGHAMILPISNSILIAETFTYNATNYVISSILSYPVANKYSGQIVYSAFSDPFTFDPNQELTFQTFITL